MKIIIMQVVVQPKLLALDTATEACSAALLVNGKISAKFELTPREHTQRIMPMLADLLTENNLSLTDLDAISFCHGPGSFTGVRIGIGIAQGLAYGAGLPLIGISTLACMAQGCWRRTGSSRVLTAIDARMGEVYWAEYQRKNDGSWLGGDGEAVLTPQQATERMAELSGTWATTGTGWQAWPQLKEGSSLSLTVDNEQLPKAEDMLALAELAWRRGAIVAPSDIEPVYLRNEVTWKKLPGR